MRERLIQLSQVLVLLASIGVIGYTIYEGQSEIIAGFQEADIALFLIGVAVIPAQMLLKRYGWRRVMHHLGEDLDFSTAMSLASLFQVGSYIPGGIWHFIGITYWGENEGLQKKKTFYGTVVNAMVNLAIGVTVFVLFGLSIIELGLLKYVIGGLSVIGLFVFLRAGVYFRLINLTLRFLDKSVLEERISSKALIEVGSIHFVARMIEGAALYIIVRSVHFIELETLPLIIAISAGAWALGFLVFFMPSGAGVKEVSLIYMLGLIIPQSIAALLSVVTRLVYMFWEIVIAVVFLYLDTGKIDLSVVNTQ